MSNYQDQLDEIRKGSGREAGLYQLCEDLIAENKKVENEMDDLMAKNLKLIKENEKLEKVIARKDVSLNHLRDIMNEPY